MIDQATVALGRERAARARKTRQRHFVPLGEGLTAVHEGDGRVRFELEIRVKATFEPGVPHEHLIAGLKVDLAQQVRDGARLADAYELALEDGPR